MSSESSLGLRRMELVSLRSITEESLVTTSVGLPELVLYVKFIVIY